MDSQLEQEHEPEKQEIPLEPKEQPSELQYNPEHPSKDDSELDAKQEDQPDERKETEAKSENGEVQLASGESNLENGHSNAEIGEVQSENGEASRKRKLDEGEDAEDESSKKSKGNEDSGVENVFVGNLTPEITDAHLLSMFQPFGTVLSAKVMLDYITKQSRLFGFIKYQDKVSALEAINKMSGQKSGMKTLVVKIAEQRSGYQEPPTPNGTPSANLYLKGFPPMMTEDQLYSLFKPYGNVQQHKVLKDPATGLSRGQGFIRFDSQQSAEYAISALNGYVFPGTVKGIVVRFADTDTEKAHRKQKVFKRQQQQSGYQTMPQGYGYNPYAFPNPYGYAAYNPLAYGTPTQSAYAAYATQSAYSPTASYATSPRYPTTDTTSPKSSAAAQTAASQSAQYAYAAAAYGTYTDPSASALATPTGLDQETALFVYHLPANADDTLLYRLFSPYGAIAHVKVMRDATTRQCKGFGFVRMTSYMSAVNAIQGLNGVQVENKTLQVSFKK